MKSQQCWLCWLCCLFVALLGLLVDADLGKNLVERMVQTGRFIHGR